MEAKRPNSGLYVTWDEKSESPGMKRETHDYSVHLPLWLPSITYQCSLQHNRTLSQCAILTQRMASTLPISTASTTEVQRFSSLPTSIIKRKIHKQEMTRVSYPLFSSPLQHPPLPPPTHTHTHTHASLARITIVISMGRNDWRAGNENSVRWEEQSYQPNIWDILFFFFHFPMNCTSFFLASLCAWWWAQGEPLCVLTTTTATTTSLIQKAMENLWKMQEGNRPDDPKI